MKEDMSVIQHDVDGQRSEDSILLTELFFATVAALPLCFAVKGFVVERS